MIYSSMTKLLEEALAKVATLPPAAQEKIGEELLLHVETVDRLRGELDKGLRLRTISLCPVLSDAGVPHARVPTPLVD